MAPSDLQTDIASLLEKFDRRSPDKLICALADEFARLHRAQALLEARLAAMETLHTISDKLLESADQYFDYPKAVIIDSVGSSIELIGFYYLEYTSNGAPFRWTGPDRHFSIRFFVSRRAPAVFILRFGRFFTDTPVEQLRAFVDGEEVLLSVSGISDSYEARGELPRRAQLGGTVLTFVVPALESPAAKGPGDSRILGLLFLGLIVTSSLESTEGAVGGMNATSDRRVP